jgi:hypothetical protein
MQKYKYYNHIYNIYRKANFLKIQFHSFCSNWSDGLTNYN